MDVRIKAFFVFSLLVTAFGCGYNRQSRFQMSFLPRATRGGAPVIELAEPPELEPNLYLKDVPAILITTPAIPQRRTPTDDTIRSADRHFQAGKRAYQSSDLVGARREFNTAIDLMLEASGQDPADR